MDGLFFGRGYYLEKLAVPVEGNINSLLEGRK